MHAQTDNLPERLRGVGGCWLGRGCGCPPSIPHNHYLSRSSSCPAARPRCFQQLLLFPKLTPLIQLLIFLLGGRGRAGEGSPEDSAPSRQADLPQTPPHPDSCLVHRGPVPVDSSGYVTGYQSAGCVTVCVSERERLELGLEC